MTVSMIMLGILGLIVLAGFAVALLSSSSGKGK